MKQYVIIGNGIAAAGCIEGIRSADHRRGDHGGVGGGTSRLLPPADLLLPGGKDRFGADAATATLISTTKTAVTVLYGRTAVRLDAEAKTVRLDDGTALPYDALCVAAGSSPFVPPFEGLETVENRFTFMTIEDALALEQAVHSDSRVLIVGAGLIGLKCAEGLARQSRGFRHRLRSGRARAVQHSGRRMRFTDAEASGEARNPLPARQQRQAI